MSLTMSHKNEWCNVSVDYIIENDFVSYGSVTQCNQKDNTIDCINPLSPKKNCYPNKPFIPPYPPPPFVSIYMYFEILSR